MCLLQLSDTEQRLKTLQADYTALQDTCEQLEEKERHLTEKLSLHEGAREKRTAEEEEEEEERTRGELSKAQELVARLQEASKRADEAATSRVEEMDAALVQAKILLEDREKELVVCKLNYICTSFSDFLSSYAVCCCSTLGFAEQDKGIV